MANNTCINIWVTPREHPDALQEGHNYEWGDYLIGSDYIRVSSEGPILRVLLNSDKEILNVKVCANPNLEHLITLNCSDESAVLFFDTFEYGSYEFPDCPDEEQLEVYSDLLETLSE